MSDVRQIITEAAARNGVDPMAALAIAQIESNMDPRAQNPRSSAGGLFQFIDSTWGQYGGGDRYDPYRNADAGARFISDNQRTLQNALGREPTPGELYLAHQQGASGALRLLRNPNTPATQIVGADAVRLNGGNANMTAAEFANLWTRRAENAMANFQGAQPNTSAQAYAPIPVPGGPPPRNDGLAAINDAMPPAQVPPRPAMSYQAAMPPQVPPRPGYAPNMPGTPMQRGRGGTGVGFAPPPPQRGVGFAQPQQDQPGRGISGFFSNGPATMYSPVPQDNWSTPVRTVGQGGPTGVGFLSNPNSRTDGRGLGGRDQSQVDVYRANRDMVGNVLGAGTPLNATNLNQAISQGGTGFVRNDMQPGGTPNRISRGPSGRGISASGGGSIFTGRSKDEIQEMLNNPTWQR